MKRYQLFLAVLVTGLSLVACGGGGGGGGSQTPDTTAPTVIATSPASSAFNVAINASISVTFSEAMTVTTVDNTNFGIRAGATPIAGNVVCVGSTATFTPLAPLTIGTLYTASVSTGVKDSAGNKMAQPYSWDFTTGSSLDLTPPQVTATVPANNATGIQVTSAITATFSEAMDPATINSSTFTLQGPSGYVFGVISYSVLTGTLTPIDNLAYSTTYTALITTGVKDLAGNSLQINGSWTFTTASNPLRQSLWDSMIWGQDNWE